jgi:hypothetical protein
MSPLLRSILVEDIGVVETTVMIVDIVEIIEIVVAMTVVTVVTMEEVTTMMDTTKFSLIASVFPSTW